MKIKNLKLEHGNRFIASHKMGSMVVLIIFLALFADRAYGQNVIHVSELKGASGMNKSMVDSGRFDYERASSLIYNRNSAAYFQKGQTKYYGEAAPVVLFVDMAQLHAISGQLDKLSKVEMVKIYLNGGSLRAVNKNVLYELPHLKYVFLVCERCVESEITSFLPQQDGAARDILVIYNSETNE